MTGFIDPSRAKSTDPVAPPTSVPSCPGTRLIHIGRRHVRHSATRLWREMVWPPLPVPAGFHKPLFIRLQKDGGLATSIRPWLRLDVEQHFAEDTTAAPSSPWSVVQKPWAPLQQHNGTTWTVASMAERIEAAEAEPGDRLGEPSGEPMTCTSPS